MSTGERLRLFVAAGVPEEHLDNIEECTKEIRDTVKEARWTPKQNQHITLKFLGGTDADLLPAVTDVCRDVAKGYRPFQVWISGLGAFPSIKRARVLWMGIDDPYKGLDGIAGDLDRSLGNLGFTPETRAYTPHLTLARFKAAKRLIDPLPEVPLDASPIGIDHVSLYRSRVSSAGAVYESLERFPLG